MSSKQTKMLIGIIVGLVVVVGLVFGAIFFLDTDSLGSSGGDIETVKANGGYEMLKSDLIEYTHMRDTQAVTIANTLFEKIGITSYEGMSSGGRRGNFTINADGYVLDSFISGGKLGTVYIGNVIIYRDADVAATAVSNVLEYTFAQYKILVNSFTKGLKVDANVGKNLYEELTLLGINSFNEIKSGKLNGIKGYYGTEGMMQYFMVVENDAIKNIYVVCDAYDPIEIYNSIGSSAKSISDVKVTMGARQGIANVLSYRLKQDTGLDVVFPAALLNGDDSWLMVRNDDEVYIEVRAEVKVKEDKKEVKDIKMRIDYESRAINYLKIDRKVYIGG